MLTFGIGLLVGMTIGLASAWIVTMAFADLAELP